MVTARLDPDGLAALEEQRSFLDRSLDDLDREHDAGDLDDHDHAELRDAYTVRRAAVADAIEHRQSLFESARRPRRPGRIVAVVAVVALVAVGAGLLVARASGERQTGQTGSGVDAAGQGPTAQAERCLGQFRTGEPNTVVACFEKVLKDDPTNPTALTYKGWVLWNYGTGSPAGQELVTLGKASLARAVRVAPTAPDPHVFLAIIAKDEGRADDAKAELSTLDRLGGAPAGMKPLVDQLRQEVTALPPSPPGSPPPSLPGSTP